MNNHTSTRPSESIWEQILEDLRKARSRVRKELDVMPLELDEYDMAVEVNHCLLSAIEKLEEYGRNS